MDKPSSVTVTQSFYSLSLAFTMLVEKDLAIHDKTQAMRDLKFQILH
jgi:hypothetical protein